LAHCISTGVIRTISLCQQDGQEDGKRHTQEVYVKSPWLAFLLSFLIAGAGFAYLGKWTWAILNLSGAIAMGLVVYRFSPDSLSIASTAVAAASLAMTAAKTMNTKFVQQSAPSPSNR
jgi:hypothetical protein